MQRTLLASLVLAGLTLGASAPAHALSNTFTYQGQLQIDGSPVTGLADLKFRLYDALTNGTQVGSQITILNTQVTSGIFTVNLGFNATLFDGNDRWLEIDVRSPSGTGTYQTLSPRQQLTATPYSLQTRGLFVDGSGNVGMGTITPAENLHVARAGGAPSIRLENLSHGTAGFQLADPDQLYELRLNLSHGLDVRDNTANAVRMSVQAGTGYVGIGTTSPTEPLHVKAPTNDAVALLETADPYATRLRITNTAPGGRAWDLISTANASGVGGGLFGVRDVTGGLYSVFLVDSLGHMAIGKGLSPSSTNMLVVGGAVECNVVQINGGSDIAEPFEVSGSDIAPGTVVSIDPANPTALRPSSHAYDRTVAGVISGAGGVNPGMMLRQPGTAADGTHPVALTGRVYVQVDADAGGAVQPGDLLTTSDTPGYAMRVDDHARAAGAILGKAMTSLDHGRGLVLVLVSLQ